MFVVTSKEEAQERVDALNKKYADATHNCYAYVLRDGSYRKFSDDGEPSGTAGIRIGLSSALLMSSPTGRSPVSVTSTMMVLMKSLGPVRLPSGSAAGLRTKKNLPSGVFWRK